MSVYEKETDGGRGNRVLSTTLLAFLVLTASAALTGAKADEPLSGESVDWTGFYLGAHAGGLSGSTRDNANSRFATSAPESEPAGVAGGVLAGYNHQIHNIVLGIEADITFADAGDGVPTPGFAHTIELEEAYSVRGRLGYALDRSLLYVTGGLAWTRSHYDFPVTLSDDWETFSGYQVGGGIEHMLTRSLSVRAEYLYGDFGSETINTQPGNPSRQTLETHSVRAALAFRFNPFGDSRQGSGAGGGHETRDWTGFYLGTHVGLLSGSTRGNLPGAANFAFDGEPSGVAGGILGGYNHQIGNIVLGVEADATFSDAADGILNNVFGARMAVKDMYSLRGRLGYAIEDSLLYVTGGYVIARAEYDSTSGPLANNETFEGFQVGGGIEHMLTESLSLRGEYLYAGFGRENVVHLAGFAAAPQSLDTHTVRAALAWHFNSSERQSPAFAVGDSESGQDDWTGLYAGVHAGALSGRSHGVPTTVGPLFTFEADPSGIAGGVLAGYNHQIRNIVLGVEADITFADTGDGVQSSISVGTMEIDTTYSLRARLGYAMDDTLLYATGGYAWAETQHRNPNLGVNDSVGYDGYQVGGGFEHRLTDLLSIRGEYLYTDFGSARVKGIALDVLPKTSVSLETHTARAALVLNLGGPWRAH